MTLTSIAQDDDQDIEATTSTTIYVCITCRRAGDPEDGVRPGLLLARATARAAEGTGVTVRQVRCLANCTRALSAAVRCDGAWTYVFGGLDADKDAGALIEGARLLARAEDGVMPWRGRPEILKRGLIARVPPIDFEEESEMSVSLARVPCTIVTGFLGSGKTTLIRHVLANANGRRLAVIVNEFGDVGIDGEILKGCGDAACPEDNIVELANGCLCCTVADEFVPALDQILAREPQVEHIVIETSGLALPKPLVQAFHWPAIKSRVTVDGVVAVVDGAALADGRVAADLAALSAQRAADTALAHDDPIEEVFEDQIACADLVVLNKRDLLDAAGMKRAIATVTGALPRAVRIVTVADGKVDPTALLGLGVGTEADIENRKTRHDAEVEHDHDDFDSFVVRLPEIGDPASIAKRIAGVAEAHNVLRVKGFAAVAGKPMRLLIQAVGPRVSHHYDRPWGTSEARQGSLVVIGLKGLDRDAVAKALLG